MRASETNDYKTEEGFRSDLQRRSALPYPDWYFEPSERRIEPSDALAHVWKQIIRSYTQANLSVNSDKLVAISGVARKLDQTHNHLAGVYLAGLWNSNLVLELLWMTIEPTPGLLQWWRDSLGLVCICFLSLQIQSLVSHMSPLNQNTKLWGYCWSAHTQRKASIRGSGILNVL
jgi:hypothetical protein